MFKEMFKIDSRMLLLLLLLLSAYPGKLTTYLHTLETSYKWYYIDHYFYKSAMVWLCSS